MKGIALDVEGGGATSAGRAQLRTGISEFLRTARDRARDRRWRWRVILCGGRDETLAAFRQAMQGKGDEFLVLLVDAEGPLDDTTSPLRHMRQHDRQALAGATEDQIHLMIQTMEAWIAADGDALAKYYGRGFHSASLPVRANLEEEPKTSLAEKLTAATRDTAKGAYHKVHHAPDLLAVIDRTRVGARCASCARLFDTLFRALAG